MKRVFCLLLIVFSASVMLEAQEASQQQGAQQEEKPVTAPLELPSFIIEGKEQLNVRAGIKQSPGKSPKLTQSELDSLNPLQKQQSYMLPSKEMPDNIRNFSFFEGYLRGQYGMFNNPLFAAGYQYNHKEYSFYADGGFEYSGEFTEKSDYLKGGLKAGLDYLAPEKYWIFGGSLTSNKINFGFRDYRLYSSQTAPERSTVNLDIMIDSKGEYEGYEFSTGAVFNTVSLSQSNADGYDNGVYGYLDVMKDLAGYSAGGKAFVDLHSTESGGTSIVNLAAQGKYAVNEQMILQGSLGFEAASSTSGGGVGGLHLDAWYRWFADSKWTLSASLFNKLSGNSFYSMLKKNPYIDNDAEVMFQSHTGFKGIARYNPLTDISAAATVLFSVEENTGYFVPDTAATGMFNVIYGDTRTIALELEADWRISSEDILTCNAGINYHTLKSTNLVPHVSPLNLAVNYRKFWIKDFATQIGVYYIGERYADANNEQKLEGYIDLRLRADYQIMPNMSLYLKFDNLTDSKIYIYEGYLERGIFAAAGLLWQF